MYDAFNQIYGPRLFDDLSGRVADPSDFINNEFLRGKRRRRRTIADRILRGKRVAGATPAPRAAVARR